MQTLTLPGLVIRRVADNWKLVLSALVGITVVTTLMAGAPIYLDALGRVGVNNSIDRASSESLDILLLSTIFPLDTAKFETTEASLDDTIGENGP